MSTLEEDVEDTGFFCRSGRDWLQSLLVGGDFNMCYRGGGDRSDSRAGMSQEAGVSLWKELELHLEWFDLVSALPCSDTTSLLDGREGFRMPWTLVPGWTGLSFPDLWRHMCQI